MDPSTMLIVIVIILLYFSDKIIAAYKTLKEVK